MKSLSRHVCFVLFSCVCCATAWAVKPSHWTHTTEADFKQGTFTRVVATNLGDLKLSRAVKTLLSQDTRISAVYALAQAPDGTIYAATGPEGILLSIKDERAGTAAEFGPHVNLFSLLVDSKGRILVGTGGERGEILRIDQPGAKPVTVFSHDDVQYIWAMLETADGVLYAATGPNGQLFRIDPNGAARLLLDSDENNLLCLISDGKDQLYIGTDPNGQVLRVNRHTGELFVVYDAPESEISAVVRDAKGNLYAATAEATERNAGEAEAEGVAAQLGRPEGESRGAPIPSHPPAPPAPPDVPKPAPGDPLPIPKQSEPLKMLIMVDVAEDAPTTGESGAHTDQPQMPGHGFPSPERERPDNGNAVYRIDPDGFVTEVFRQQVTVFAMIEQSGTLLVATGGDEGAVYQVNPGAEETLTLATVDSKDVLCLLPAKDGRVFLGLANSGEVAAMSADYPADGTYISPVLDAQQISRFGKMHLRGTLPAGTALRIATRSGNVEEASAPGWSNWSQEVSAAQFLQISSAPARFLQYRLTFESSGGKETPVLEEVDVVYQMPNLPPQISAVQVTGGGEDETGGGTLSISWEATDPNEDDLQYSLLFRNGPRAPWIVLKEKVTDPPYEWDTKGVADGRYEIKIEATDKSANPVGEGKTASRVSDPVIVDNTAPLIGDSTTRVNGADVTIALKVVDRASTVSRLEYAVDSADDWQTVLPSDSICDSPEEAYEFVVGSLSPGAHQITVRASDSKSNRAFATFSVTVEKPPAK